MAQNKSENKREEHKETTEEVSTVESKANVNTLEKMPNVHTGPAPKNERLLPVDQWRELKNTKRYLHDAMLAKMGWRPGKEVTEGEYIKALASLGGTKNA